MRRGQAKTEKATMRSILLAAMAIPAVTGEALAETLSLVCENPRQEYLVSYDPAKSTVHANDTLYRVLAVEETPERLVVVGLTVNDGPTFRLHIRPYKKMEFFSGSQLFQTDGCR